MTSLGRTLNRLAADPGRIVLQEVRRGEITPLSAGAVLLMVAVARAFLREAAIVKGDRCVLVAPNSVHWIALTLALRAEGAVSVPLSPQRPIEELSAIVRQSEPRFVFGDDPRLLARLAPEAPGEMRISSFEEIFAPATVPPETLRAVELAAEDPVAIIYTSGTSGEPKGAVLTMGGVEHVIACAGARLDALAIRDAPERVLHYLPFCFAGSWILLLTCVSRDAIVSVSLDPKSLAVDLAAVRPHYLLNVPLVLERIRSGVVAQIASRPRLVRAAFDAGWAAWRRKHARAPWAFDGVRLHLLRRLIVRPIRQRLGPDLRALICGSAPLARETQLWFQMLGIPVYQVYGLTETTAVCTIDRAEESRVVPGRVGVAIDGVELRLDETGEILARGPNIFAGYWRNPEATSRVLRHGWLRTGDYGDVDAEGNWRIGGRVDNLIVRPNGLKIAPERLEELLASRLPAAEHVAVVDGGTAGLIAVVSGKVTAAQLSDALEWLNARVAPHEMVRTSRLHDGPLTIENEMLTANGKLKRNRIAAWCRNEPVHAELSVKS